MKNIKKVVGLFMLSAMMVVMPYKITSASVETNIKRVEEKANTVEISVDKINYEVKSFSLSLKIDGDVTLDSLTWSDTLSDKSVVKNYKYDSVENVVDIYVTSSKNLVEYSNLKVASIKVKGEMDANYNISGKGKFKFIYSDKNRDGEMDSLPSNNNEEFKFIKASNIPDNDNNLGQDGEKPGTDDNSGQDGEKPGTDNNLGQDEENPDNDNNQNKEENSTDSKEESNESLENNDSNNKEDASSNEVQTSDNLLRNIFIVLIVLSGGVILIYNFKKKRA
ncbi:hypothetical protein [Clostridium sp.]|uniref:hypothetical protein n=1 Tax=Clostridium sp. TaxID=1506 RepID=UPI00290221A0|nr:hypothetical protein [Clostridium sp.]MBS7130009.1 hypothetical protein [Clostridium sp.]MDU2282250.1 hypothetical protein [Clostridium sp.]MDU3410966.1 hypothetical protein [Clostridium sp.]